MTVSKSPTLQQQAIIKFVRDPKAGNLVIDALAGSGKTSTMLEALKGIPQRSVLLTAFNKRIADELQAKLPKQIARTHAVHVKTFHALGFAMIKNARPDLERAEGAVEDLVNRVCEGRGASFNQKRWICRLLGILKGTWVAVPEPHEIMDVGFEWDIFSQKASERDIEYACNLTHEAYIASQDISKLTAIDFDDMTWLPVVAGLEPVSRYQAVVVDELQDISIPQFELLRRVMMPTTRLLAVGDRNQAIYGWRGGLGDRAWAIMQNEFQASMLQLSTTFRCATSIVKQANEIVPQLQAMDDADEGSIETISMADLPTRFVGGITNRGSIHTFVLSRRNDDLLDAAMFLHRSRVSFQLNAGKELLSPLFYLLDFVIDTNTIDRFHESLDKWRVNELAKAQKRDSPSAADRTEQHFYMLKRAMREVSHPLKIKSLLHALLSEGVSGVLLSTVHKVKGLEADRVYLLRNSFGRHRMREADDSDTRTIGPVEQEELNLEYVGITRARHHLIWVDDRLGKQIDVSEAIEACGTPALLKKLTRRELDDKLAIAEREAQRLAGSNVEHSDAWMNYAQALLDEIKTRPL